MSLKESQTIFLDDQIKIQSNSGTLNNILSQFIIRLLNHNFDQFKMYFFLY